MAKSIASSVLEHARRIVDGRNAGYGSVNEMFPVVAQLWSVVLGCEVQPWKVALCLDLLKTARVLAAPGSLDSWADKCGYSALGAQVAPISPDELATLNPDNEVPPCSR